MITEEALCGIPHVISELPTELDLAIINAAISTAIKATNKRGGKVSSLSLVAGQDLKTIQVKIEYERQTS